MRTMCNEERKIHGTHKEIQCKKWVIKEDLLFTQRVTMHIMGNEGRKTHCSHKE
ncbi:hypothetical protein KSS87_014058, partial [Heliosperma pusillum]